MASMSNKGEKRAKAIIQACLGRIVDVNDDGSAPGMYDLGIGIPHHPEIANRSRVLTMYRLSFFVFLFGAIGSAQVRSTYSETFDRGPGGWISNRYHPLTLFDGVAYLFGPWYLDSHHAPPGAGYLHMLMYLYTKAEKHNGKIGGPNGFTRGSYSTDLRSSKLTVRLRGEMDLQGSNMVVLVQSKTAKTTANFVLTGQPFRIGKEWSEQTVMLAPDPKQWTCLGGRESQKNHYGCDDIDTVLKDVNVDLMLVLFPLNVVPVRPVTEPHKLRAGQDYPGEPSYEVWQKHLPKGLIMVDSIKLEYPR